jgi:hypothetical protein
MTERTIPIIEVLLTDSGKFTYRLRATQLSTKAYAQILAALAVDVAEMFENESEGKLPKEAVYAQICEYLRESLEDSPPQTNLGMLQ